MAQVEEKFHFLCIYIYYSDRRKIMHLKAANMFPAFDELDKLEKYIYLMNNVQRHLYKCAVYGRSSSLFYS